MDIKITKHTLKNIGIDCKFMSAIDINNNQVMNMVYKKLSNQHKSFLTQLSIIKFKRKKKKYIYKPKFNNIVLDIIKFFAEAVDQIIEKNNNKYKKFINCHAIRASISIPNHIYAVDDLINYGYEELFRAKKIYRRKSLASFDTFFTSCLIQRYKNLSRNLYLYKYGNVAKTLSIEELEQRGRESGSNFTPAIFNDDRFIEKIDRAVLFNKIYKRLQKRCNQKKIFAMLISGHTLFEIRKTFSRDHVRKFIIKINTISKRMKIS